MNGCPPCDDIDRMLTIAPSMPFRIITFAASCIRKNGARTLTANIVSKSSGLVSTSVPRSVIAAAFTRTSTRPNARTAAGTIFARPRRCRRGRQRRKSSCSPLPVISSATALPRFLLRPTTTRPAAPRSAKRRAIASPKPLRPAGDNRDLALELVLHPSPRALPDCHVTARRRTPPRAGGATLRSLQRSWQDDAQEAHPRCRHRDRRCGGGHARGASSGARARRLHYRQRQCRGASLHRQHAARA